MTNQEIDQTLKYFNHNVNEAIRHSKDRLAIAIAVSGVVSMLAEIAKRLPEPADARSKD